MNSILIAAAVAMLPIGAALFCLFRTLSRRQSAEIGADGALELRVGRYRPMGRLLSQEDFRFLATQPGYSPGLGRRFRTARREIFRGYLKCLKKDFSRVSLTFQALIIHSAEDRGDLAAGLVRQRLVFSLAMLAVEGRLLLHAAGLNVVTVDCSGLVASLESMQNQMRLLLTPPQLA